MAPHFRFRVPLMRATNAVLREDARGLSRIHQPRGCFRIAQVRYNSTGIFSSLHKNLGWAINNMGRRGRISQEEIDETMRLVRIQLLEADVAVAVVNDFVDRVGKACADLKVDGTIPGPASVLRVVHAHLVEMLGTDPVEIVDHSDSDGPVVFLLCGVQGSGKTTTCAKLGLYLQVGRSVRCRLASLYDLCAADGAAQEGADGFSRHPSPGCAGNLPIDSSACIAIGFVSWMPGGGGGGGGGGTGATGCARKRSTHRGAAQGLRRHGPCAALAWACTRRPVL